LDRHAPSLINCRDRRCASQKTQHNKGCIIVARNEMIFLDENSPDYAKALQSLDRIVRKKNPIIFGIGSPTGGTGFFWVSHVIIEGQE